MSFVFWDFFLCPALFLSACGQPDQHPAPTQQQIDEWNTKVDAGIAAVRAGKGAEAESIFDSVYKMNHDIDMGGARKSKIFLWWAKAHAEKKEWENALGRIQQSTKYFLDSGNTNNVELAEIYEAAGEIKQAKGDYAEAESIYAEALDSLEKGRETPGAPVAKVSVLTKLASCYKAENKKAKAEAIEKQARDLERALPKSP